MSENPGKYLPFQDSESNEIQDSVWGRAILLIHHFPLCKNTEILRSRQITCAGLKNVPGWVNLWSGFRFFSESEEPEREATAKDFKLQSPEFS